MIRYRFLLLCLALSISLFSEPAVARTVVVSAEYTYQVPENISPDQAREIALARAQAKAIADEFGMVVTQSTSTMIDNRNNSTSTEFLALGGSELKGEWIEDIESPVYEYLTDGSNLAIRVRVKGKIRESNNARIPLDIKILCNGVTDANETDRFTSGDDLYISFASPVQGYLAVYLVDTSGTAYCLLPYQAQTDGVFNIKANQKYILFHPDHCIGVRTDEVDPVEVYAEEQERNRIIIVFSPNKFYKGTDTKIDSTLPRSMPKASFEKWLSDLRKKDLDLSLMIKAILINPAN